MGAQSEEMVDTRWVLTWREVDGVKPVKAQLVAKGDQAPDLRNDVRFADRVAWVADRLTCS